MLDGGGQTPYLLLHPLQVHSVVHSLSLVHAHLKVEHASLTFLGFLPHVHLVGFLGASVCVVVDSLGSAQS